MAVSNMHGIAGMLSNRCLWAAMTAWFLAQFLKVPTYWLVEKKWDWHHLIGSGGMPSSHSAGVVALTITVGAFYGFDTAEFALCFVFGSIVMYDAAGVRRETGRQGKAINEIISRVLVEGQPITDKELKEIVGHTPFEVFMGALTGFLVAILWLII